MEWKNAWLGICLIFLGVILLMVKTDILVIGWNTLWPIFVLGPGLILEGAFIFNRQAAGILVPGGILTVCGLTFFICSIFGWGLMVYLWPLFPFSVAFGLFQLYVFDGHEKGLLVPVAILGGFSFIAFITTLATTVLGEIIPFVIIALGVYIYFKGRQRTKSSKM